MLSRSVALSLLSGLLAVSLSSCSSAPKPKPETSRSVNLLCHEGARAFRFDKAGVPEGERPVDLALTPKAVWVLFDSGRVMQLSRGGERLEVQMRFLPGAGGSRLDVDPVDGAVWAVSPASLDLYRISPEGTLKTVKFQRKVEGAGGFSGLLVGRDAIYAQPTCAESAVWRLDRSGKLLGTAFQAPERPEGQPDVMHTTDGQPDRNCYTVRLERDQEGRILAWDSERRTVSQVDAEGNWSPSDSRLFAHLKEPSFALKGVDVGESSEQWFFSGVSGGLFFWKGQPVFLGSYTAKERSLGNDTVLYVAGADGPREVLMSCNGFPVSDVATDATGYAALTERFLILGDLAGAPDLL